MSLEAMVWALKRAPIPGDDALAQLVLIGLADHARDDGDGARPTARTLAQYARCSVRTVQNKLRLLEEAGLIAVGDCREVAHLRADRRPSVWNLNLSLDGVQQVQVVDDGVNGGTARGERPYQAGCTAVPSGVHAVADRTVPEPSLEPSLNLSSSTAARSTDTDELFATFWHSYPRRVGRKAARKRWDAAIADGADPRAIIDGARRFADDPNREDAFTAHPSTWLNQGRWDDDPLPARASDGYASRQDAVLLREREWARAADAADVSGRRALEGGGSR